MSDREDLLSSQISEGPLPKSRRSGVGLSLSGGGFRAALFHLGALRRLNELGVLQQLDSISSVSGGSIISAFLACNLQFPLTGSLPDWEDRIAKPFRAFCAQNLRRKPILEGLLPWKQNSEVLAEQYELNLTKGKKLSELPSAKPLFIFCGTDLLYGVSWIFTQPKSGDYQAGYVSPTPADWKLSTAVAVSSCFPPVFKPIALPLDAKTLKGGAASSSDRQNNIGKMTLSDGGVYRVIAVIDGNTSVLHSMSGLNYTAKYPHIAESLKWLKLKEAVFDGEVVALDESGKASFQELQNARLTRLPIIYYVFDLLHLKGKDSLDLPLMERRKQLERVAIGFRDPLRLNPSFRVALADFTASVQKLGLEGIVAKRSDSIYIPGKESDAWRKHRFNQEDEFVVGGYIPGGQNFSELLIGEERDNELVFVKRLIAGFVPHTRAEVFEAIKGLRTKKCPFSNLPESRKSQHALTAEKMRECVWVKPERRCEVEFVERTKGGRLRHPEFRRLVR